MSEQTKEPNNPASPAPAAPESDELDQNALDQIDSLLAEVDPTFNDQVASLRAEKFEGDLEVENFEIDAMTGEKSAQKTPAKPPTKLGRFFQNRIAGAKSFISFIFGFISGFFANIGNSIQLFFSLSRRGKLIVLATVLLAGALIFIVEKSLTGRLLPDFELKFLTNFGKVADRSFKIEEGEQFEDFDNPLRHPEYIVLIERLVVNLKGSEANESPMGMFEFYVEASTQDGAIEINERQKEIRDLMARTIETESYSNLSTVEGKDKMKQTLRRELNTLLTHGRVRRVFFKTIILKP